MFLLNGFLRRSLVLNLLLLDLVDELALDFFVGNLLVDLLLHVYLSKTKGVCFGGSLMTFNHCLVGFIVAHVHTKVISL